MKFDQELLGQFPERLSVTFVSPVLGCLELPPPGGGLRRSHDQIGPIGADIEQRVRIDLQEIEDRPINYQRQAVSVLREFLDHLRLRTSNVSPWRRERPPGLSTETGRVGNPISWDPRLNSGSPPWTRFELLRRKTRTLEPPEPVWS